MGGIFGALVIAAIPSCPGSHELTLTVAFTWHTPQPFVTFGPPPVLRPPPSDLRPQTSDLPPA